MSLTKTEAAAFCVFRKQEIQSSWDWDADYRFACEINNEEVKDWIEQCKSSFSPVVVGVYRQQVGKHTQKRIRALNSLTKKGYCEASWIGTGFGGGSEFGVKRIRVWKISELGKDALKDLIFDEKLG